MKQRKKEGRFFEDKRSKGEGRKAIIKEEKNMEWYKEWISKRRKIDREKRRKVTNYRIGTNNKGSHIKGEVGGWKEGRNETRGKWYETVESMDYRMKS